MQQTSQKRPPRWARKWNSLWKRNSTLARFYHIVSGARGLILPHYLITCYHIYNILPQFTTFDIILHNHFRFYHIHSRPESRLSTGLIRFCEILGPQLQSFQSCLFSKNLSFPLVLQGFVGFVTCSDPPSVFHWFYNACKIPQLLRHTPQLHFTTHVVI